MTIRVLYTAGPTHEPIDAVRYLGNRSSGTLGVALASDAASRGWSVRLLLGPVDSGVVSAVPGGCVVERFTTARSLGRMLDETPLDSVDALVMAAAVADYEVDLPGVGAGKLRRGELDTLRLIPTPDLVGAFSKRRGMERSPAVVGFALEPGETLERRAAMKLHAKGIDMVVANALETIGATEIRATLVYPDRVERFDGMEKARFAAVLNDRIAGLVGAGGV